MATLNLLRKSTVHDPNSESWRMTLEVTSSEDITKYVFVNQRLRNFIKNNFEDAFAAVCTPTQIEDLDIGSPSAATSYFRVSKIDIVVRSLAYLEEIFLAILRELQNLVKDVESLNNLLPDGIYTITADNIDENMSILHSHYRIPLFARPCGTREDFADGDVTRQRVANVNTTISGWLNTTGTDPAGYKFKYNIAEDATLNALWPPDADKLVYAHLEVNGLTESDLLITTTGLFWKNNLAGYCPWPIDWLSVNNEGLPENGVILTLDIIK